MKTLSRLLTSFLIGVLIFSGAFSAQAFNLPPALDANKSTQLVEDKLEKLVPAGARGLQEEYFQFNRKDYIRTRDELRFKLIDFPDPVEEEGCIEGEEPELDIVDVSLQSIDESADKSALVYHFAIEVINSHETVAYGPAEAENVVLSVIDENAVEASANPAEVTYGDLISNFAITHHEFTNSGSFLKLDCGASYTLTNIQVEVPKEKVQQKLRFLVDSTQVVQEQNEASNQDANTLFKVTDNNAESYSIIQPYSTFLMNLVDYNSESGDLSFDSDVTYYGNDSEKDLIALGYGFEVEVLEIPQEATQNDFFSENDPNTIIDQVNELVYHYNYLLSSYDFEGASTSLNSTVMNMIGYWASNSPLNINVNQNQLAVLNMTTPGGETFRLYGAKPVSTKQEVINCDTETEACTGLVFERLSPLSVESDASVLPENASQFEFCNTGEAAATVESFRFEVIMQGAPNFVDDYKVVNEFFLNGQSIWMPITYPLNNIGGTTTKESEIVLLDPLLVSPQECHSLDVELSAVDSEIDFQSINLIEVNSNAPVYFYDEYNLSPNSLAQLGGKDKESWEFKKLVGTTLVFNPETGAHFSYESFFYDYNSDTYSDLNLARLLISTNPNQTLSFNELQFETSAPSWGETEIQAEVTIIEEAPWYVPYRLWDYPDAVTTVKNMTLPANGITTLGELDINLSYGERAAITVDISGTVPSSELLTGSFIGVNTPTENSYMDNHLAHLQSSYPIDYKFSDTLSFPLSRTIEFTLADNNIINRVDANIWPISVDGNWTDWHSFLDYSQIYDASIYFNGENHAPNGPKVEFSDWQFTVEGDFDTIDLRIEIKGPEDADGIPSIDIVYLTVTQGENFSLQLPSVYKWENLYIDFYLDSYPDLDYFDLDLLYLIPEPFTATLDGEPVEVYIQEKEEADGFIKSVTNIFDHAIYTLRKYAFGKELLYAASENSPFKQIKQIAFMDPGEEITMNKFCLHSVGDNEIEMLKFLHDTHELQPFENVTLSYGNEKIFLPLSGWSATEAVFYPTPDVEMWHNSKRCFELAIEGPKQEISNAFFDLVQVQAKIKDSSVTTPAFSNATSMQEISVSNPVAGTVYDFK